MGILAWTVAWAVVCGAVASARGRSFFGWFLIGALISPLALIVLFAMENLAETKRRNLRAAEESRDLRECPFCAESIKRQATVCKFCRKEVVPV